ncbi:MAG: TVP38/TMEM64 family protein [Acidobacteria bacterium]|nr:TVP38/TMEM64 family protein [Acidobacteriota bacterium]
MKNRKIMLGLILLTGVGLVLMFLPVRHWFNLLQDEIKSLGPMGPVIFVIAYVITTILLIPGSAMTIGAGTVFGLKLGLISVITGANLAALGAFLLARTFLREKVRHWAEENPKFAALDRAIGREGFKMVLLARLSPVFPFTLLNYLLGLTRINIVSYVAANLIGMLPGTLLYTYIGATARDALSSGDGGLDKYRLLLRMTGLAATIGVVFLVTRMARKAMAEVESERKEDEAIDG